MPTFKSFKDLAVNLLAKNGTDVTLISVGTRTYDPQTRQATAGETTVKAKGFFANWRTATLEMFPGFEASDRVVMLAGQGLKVQPKAGDRLRVGGLTYNVKAVNSVAPDGGLSVIIWYLRVGP